MFFVYNHCFVGTAIYQNCHPHKKENCLKQTGITEAQDHQFLEDGGRAGSLAAQRIQFNDNLD